MKNRFAFYLIATFLSGVIHAEEATNKDPTKPAYSKIKEASKTPESLSSFQLQSIIVGKTRQLALINDKLVRVGEKVGGAEVVAINTYSVVLVQAGRKITLYLFDSSIRN